MNGPELGDKRTVTAVLVKQLWKKVLDRNMELLPFRTRCVRAGDIHELATTDQPARACAVVRRIGFVGFVEFTCGGVIEQGDEVWADDRLLGTVIGFDGCHAPNHLNVIVHRSAGLTTAADLGLEIEAPVRFVPARPVPSSGQSLFLDHAIRTCQ